MITFKALHNQSPGYIVSSLIEERKLRTGLRTSGLRFPCPKYTPEDVWWSVRSTHLKTYSDRVPSTHLRRRMVTVCQVHTWRRMVECPKYTPQDVKWPCPKYTPKTTYGHCVPSTHLRRRMCPKYTPEDVWWSVPSTHLKTYYSDRVPSTHLRRRMVTVSQVHTWRRMATVFSRQLLRASETPYIQICHSSYDVRPSESGCRVQTIPCCSVTFTVPIASLLPGIDPGRPGPIRHLRNIQWASQIIRPWSWYKEELLWLRG